MGTLSLVVGDRQLSGWTSIRVSRSMERMPSDFEIELTDLYPGEMSKFVVVPGDACQVLLDKDLVLTGYVDGYKTSLSAGKHSIRIVGRSKCCDLVDASAQWPGGQISSSSVVGTAQKLAAPYNIKVEGIAEGMQPIPTYVLHFGETAYEIIERLCRFRALIAYDLPNGDLRLARASTIRTSSGLEEGVNVEECSIDYRVDQRFSNYVVMTMSTDIFSDAGLADVPAAVADDPGILRNRIKYIINEAATTNRVQAQQRADWEYRRRAGRSAQLHVTVDSWRDSRGLLWEPNTLVRLDLPTMKVVERSWLIVDVTYKIDGQRGTTCELRIMPPEAFEVQPPDVPSFQDIRKALQGTPLAPPTETASGRYQ